MGRKILASAVVVALLLTLVARAWAHGEFRYPVNGTLGSSYWTPRWYGPHGALDIHAPMWREIGASRGGQVIFAGWYGPYGNLLKIQHETGYTTYYAHMVSIAVSYGQWVTVNQKIGYVGSTGNSGLPHVHFEIRRYGSTKYLPPDSWGAVITRGAAIPWHYPDLSTTTVSLKVVQITSTTLNVRSGAGTGYSIKGQVLQGQRYVRIAVSGSWEKIWYDGTTGWVHGGYTWNRSGVPAVKVTWSTINVRKGPGMSYDVAGTAGAGQYYAKMGATDGWIRICFRGKDQRWVKGAGTNTFTP